jgi:predicted RNA binding protein YcfA (HicA-like mRNA interferase family)
MPKLHPVSYKQLVKIREAEGFAHIRTEGDHLVFGKPGIARPVVVPKYAAVPVFNHQKQSADRGHFTRALSKAIGRITCRQNPASTP